MSKELKRVADDELDAAIVKIFPDCTPTLASEIRKDLLAYLAAGLSDGYDLALIKRVGDKTKIKVMRLRERKFPMEDKNS